VPPRTLIVYGNCQAEAIATIFKRDPLAEGHFRVMYLRNFEHPADEWEEMRSVDVTSCAVLCEQHDPGPFPFRDLLPPTCVTVRFPAIDFNLLWPFNCVNPYQEPRPPVFPFGPFPYGDRVIVECLEKGMRPREILEYYLTGWDRYGMDLDRLLQIESARLTSRDRHCEIKMADHVLGRFREERLFWTPNHPTNALLRELIGRLLPACIEAEPELASLDIDATLATRLPPEGPLGVVDIPIHPKIAEHYGVKWYDPSERHQTFGGGTYSYTEYFEAMIEDSLAVRRSREA
jgi:hypothetical protein